ncbi:MAG: hypothetical protein HYV15_06405, partial [Elusimicrobia bacterium]|nr:hypothetical protein [Elusimicrobiota bacterium]
RILLTLPGQDYAPGDVPNNGRIGAVDISTAGSAFFATLRVTDAFFNTVVSSSPVGALLTHDDPNAAQPSVGTWGSGAQTISVSLKSKRGAWSVPPTGAGTETVLRSTGIGTAGGLNSQSIRVQANGLSATKNLLLQLPGEGLSPGSPSGKTSTVPSEQEAGSTFTATVYAADQFFNPYEPLQLQQPDVRVDVNTNYALVGGSVPAVGVTTITLVQGSTTFAIWLPVASTTTLITAKALTAPFVDNSTRVSVSPTGQGTGAWRLQLLLPNMAQDPGSPTGSKNPVQPLVVGATVTATVNLVDRLYNTVYGTTTKIGTVDYPNVNLQFSDGNMASRGVVPSTQALVNGTRSFSFFPVTRTDGGGLPLQSVTAIVQSGIVYAQSTISNIVVNPGPATRLQLILHTETPAEGSPTGKAGSLPLYTAGQGPAIKIRATDDYWNLTSEPRTVALTVSDVYASTPSAGPLVSGEANINFTPRTSTAAALLTLQAIDVDSILPRLATFTVTGVGVKPDSYVKLLTLIPGETYVPGKPPYDSGVTGGRAIVQSTTVPAGTPFTFTVRAVDGHWNTVPVNSGVGMYNDDPAAVVPTPSLTLVGGVTTFTYTPVSIGNHTVGAAAASVNSSTSNVFAVAGSRLSLLAPGESPDPGNVGALGRQGTPDRDGASPGVQPFIAGTPFTVTVKLTDASYYPITAGVPITLRFYSDDPYAVLPPDTAMPASGQATAAVTLSSATALLAGTRVWVEPVGNPNISVSTSSALLVDPAAPSRLLVLAPGMSLDKGSPLGYTGSPVATAAGSGYPIAVFVTDAFHNPVLCSQYPVGLPAPDCVEPGVRVQLGDPYAPAVADHQITGGSRSITVEFRANTVIDPVGGPWTVSVS